MPTPAEISARDSKPAVDPNTGPEPKGDPKISESEAWGTNLNPVRNPSPIGPSYPVGGAG